MESSKTTVRLGRSQEAKSVCECVCHPALGDVAGELGRGRIGENRLKRE